MKHYPSQSRFHVPEKAEAGWKTRTQKACCPSSRYTETVQKSCHLNGDQAHPCVGEHTGISGMDFRNTIRKFAHIFRIQVSPSLGKRLLVHQIFLEKVVVSIDSQLQRVDQPLQQNAQNIFRAKFVLPCKAVFFRRKSSLLLQCSTRLWDIVKIKSFNDIPAATFGMSCSKCVHSMLVGDRCCQFAYCTIILQPCWVI